MLELSGGRCGFGVFGVVLFWVRKVKCWVNKWNNCLRLVLLLVSILNVISIIVVCCGVRIFVWCLL